MPADNTQGVNGSNARRQQVARDVSLATAFVRSGGAPPMPYELRAFPAWA